MLRLYAVNINRTPKQPWTGYGVYLGKGVVITAAHVVGRASLTKPTVVIAGQNLEAKVIKEGEFDKVDLTLLSIDARRLPIGLQMRLMPICQGPPRVGQDVVVAIPEAVAHSRIMSAQRLPPDVRERFDTVIADVASTGNSGSGVFDAERQCLMGVMSRKIQEFGHQFEPWLACQAAHRHREVFRAGPANQGILAAGIRLALTRLIHEGCASRLAGLAPAQEVARSSSRGCARSPPSRRRGR